MGNFPFAAPAGTATGAGTIPQLPLIMNPCKWGLANTDTGPNRTRVTYSNGAAGIGATLTALDNGVMEIGGSNPAVGDRFFYADPYNAIGSDGIYVVTGTGSVSTPWTAVRSSDCDTPAAYFQFWGVEVTTGWTIGGTDIAAGSWAVNQWMGNISNNAPFVPPGVIGTQQLGFAVAVSGSFASGQATSAYGPVSAAFGQECTATGDNALALGNTAVASGNSSTALGYTSSAAGQQSTAIGSRSYALGALSVALGAGSLAYPNGSIAEGSGADNALGDSQSVRMYPNNETTDATPTNLVGPFNNQFQFRDSSGNPTYKKTLLLNFSVTARRTDSPGNDAVWTGQAALFGDGVSAYSWNGGTPPALTKIFSDGTTTGWAVAVSVTGGNTLQIQVTGAAGATILWVAKIETIEVTG